MTESRREVRALADVVFNRRHELDMTQVELADKARVAHRTVQHIEAGTTRPVPAIVAAVAGALGLDVDELQQVADATPARAS